MTPHDVQATLELIDELWPKLAEQNDNKQSPLLREIARRLRSLLIDREQAQACLVSLRLERDRKWTDYTHILAKLRDLADSTLPKTSRRDPVCGPEPVDLPPAGAFAEPARRAGHAGMWQWYAADPEACVRAYPWLHAPGEIAGVRYERFADCPWAQEQIRRAKAGLPTGLTVGQGVAA